MELSQLGHRGEDLRRGNVRVSEMVQVKQIRLKLLSYALEYSGPAPQQRGMFGLRELVENTIGYAGLVFITRVEGDFPLGG